MHTTHHQQKMSIFGVLKSVLIVFVSSLAVIAILLSVALGLKTSLPAGHTFTWYQMVGIILLTAMIVVNFINSVKLIRMYRLSSLGGKATSTEHSTSYESLEANPSCQEIRGSSSTGSKRTKAKVKQGLQ